MQIKYEFVAVGAGDIAREFRSISAEARASKAATDGMYKASVVGAGQASRAAQSYGREAKRPISDIERLAKKVAADQEAAARKAADAEIREAKRAAQGKAKAYEHVFQIRQRYEQQLERQAQAAAAREAKAAASARSERLKTIGRLGKDVALAGIGIGASALGVVGGAAREGVRLNDITNRLSISARGAGEQAADPSQLRREFQAAALGAPGIKAADIAEGVQGFVAKTGDLATGRKFASTFATAASATGSDVQDIANAAADISQKFDITGIEEMKDALASLTFQGKAGAFELKDAASQFARLSSAASRFGLDKGAKGLATLGGLSQIARSATGSPEQAATAVEAMFRQLTAGHSGKLLKAAGVDVFQKGSTSKTRDIRDIIVDSISKTGGSQTKLQGIFGDEGIRAISPLISTFNQSRDATKGSDAEKTAAGIAALRDALAKAIDAPGDWSEVVKDAAQAQQSAGAQLDGAWESLKAKVADEVVPALVKLAPKVSKLVDGIDPAITVFTALVEAAELVVDAFKVLGLIKPKNQTPEERYQKAKKDLETYQGQLDKRNHLLTGDEVAKKRALQAELDAAEKAAFTHVNVAKGEKQGALTAEDFAAQYAALGANPNDARNKREAEMLASGIKSDPTGGIATNDFYRQNFTGENDAQTRLRHQFQEQVAFEKGSTAGAAPAPADPAKLNAAADKLAAAADKLAAGGGQPSITGAPLVGGTQ